MNPADVQAILAQHDSPSPGIDGLQRLADWGTGLQKIMDCIRIQDLDGLTYLTRNECLAIMHYIKLLDGI